jgi:hypothetical protein
MAPVARREHLGTIDWQNLPVYWQQVAELVARLEALWDRPRDPTALTARAFDEAQTAGTRTYIEAQRCLGVAIDNHEALLALLQADGATVWAPWSLIRPTVESSFLALWLLDPVSGLERRRRGLRLEVQDAAAPPPPGVLPAPAQHAQSHQGPVEGQPGRQRRDVPT